MGRPRPTLKDIAQATGFSANTVSLALRGSPRLPEQTRQLILKEAKRLNYSPNRIARSLASSATGTIGLVMTDILNPTLTLAARTIERELAEAGYAVMFAASDASLENEKHAIALFQSYQVDGMLIYPADRKVYDHIQTVDESGTPVILLAALPEAGLDIVAIDDSEGAYRAFRHLCAAGHRRFAMLDGGRGRGNLDKLSGAKRAVRDAGLPEDAIALFEPESHAATEGYALMAAVGALEPRPTAVFGSTDSLALGVLSWCRENGVAVPGDMAVVGYDNTENSAFCVPPLTTVNYAADEVSRLGVDRILRRLSGDEDWFGPETRLIEPDLVVRETG